MNMKSVKMPDVENEELTADIEELNKRIEANVMERWLEVEFRHLQKTLQAPDEAVKKQATDLQAKGEAFWESGDMPEVREF